MKVYLIMVNNAAKKNTQRPPCNSVFFPSRGIFWPENGSKFVYFLLYNVLLSISFEHGFLLVTSSTDLEGAFKFAMKFNKDTFGTWKNSKTVKYLIFWDS